MKSIYGITEGNAENLENDTKQEKNLLATNWLLIIRHNL